MELLHNLGAALSIESINHYVDFFGPFIYVLIFIIAFFESVVFAGLLLPGTLIVVATGFIASQGSLSICLLFVVTSTAAISGDIFNFYLGMTRGEKLITSITDKFGLKTDYLKIGEDFFRKHGDKSVFIGRFAAVMRPFIPFIAGIFKMRIRVFLFWNILSGVIWAGLFLALGYFFGAAIKTIVAWSGRAGVVIFVVAIFALVTHYVRKRITKSS